MALLPVGASKKRKRDEEAIIRTLLTIRRWHDCVLRLHERRQANKQLLCHTALWALRTARARWGVAFFHHCVDLAAQRIQAHALP